ncbi:MAG: copper chaperone PCu(A)C [Oleispira antarctica]|nr:copper chaperone PCu(A)C [Oleispira antarctica]MBQ0793787.1 copper chaperone PCu(A)C [Oleispira antarctica]
MKYNQQSTRFFAIIFTLLLSSSVVAELVVEEGYVRKPIPGRSMSAAFMTINNTGKDDVILKTAAIEGAKSVEIHTHTHTDGVMRMRQLHELTISAGGSVVLEPGGLHLMIFGIETLPDNPQLTLCDENNQCSEFTLSVRKLVQ